MLKISLKQGQYVNIGDNIRVVYVGGTGNHGRLMIDAPKEVKIARRLNSHPSFPFCKRVSHFESDLQILYPTFHFCNDFPVFFLAFMI